MSSSHGEISTGAIGNIRKWRSQKETAAVNIGNYLYGSLSKHEMFSDAEITYTKNNPCSCAFFDQIFRVKTYDEPSTWSTNVGHNFQ